MSLELGKRSPRTREITRLLDAWQTGEDEALERLIHQIYPELRALAACKMRGERPEHTLQPTAVVHELYLRLASYRRTTFRDRQHFYRTALRAIRRILVDHARHRTYQKRGGAAARIRLDDLEPWEEPTITEAVAMNEALACLARQTPDLARIVELRYFGGLTSREIGSQLGLSIPTVTRRFADAKAWLRSYFQGDDDP